MLEPTLPQGGFGAALLGTQAWAGPHSTLLGTDLGWRGLQTVSCGSASQGPLVPLTWRRCWRGQR